MEVDLYVEGSGSAVRAKGWSLWEIGQFVVIVALHLGMDLFKAGFENVIPFDVLADSSPRSV